jgi:hypothetical protein
MGRSLSHIAMEGDADGHIEGCAVTKILDVVEGHPIEPVGFQHTLDFTKHVGIVVYNDYWLLSHDCRSGGTGVGYAMRSPSVLRNAKG